MSFGFTSHVQCDSVEEFSVALVFLITVFCWLAGSVKTILDCPDIILSG